MKKAMITAIVLIWSVCSMAEPGGTTVYLGQIQSNLRLLRATANEDPNTDINSMAITTSTADWAHRPTDANGLKRFERDELGQTRKYYIGLMACAGSAAEKTFTTNIWLWFKDNSPAVKAVSIAWTTGNQQVLYYPHALTAAATGIYWADTGVVTRYWPITVGQGTDGSNSAKMIIIDTAGADGVYCEVTGADGTTGVEAGNVTVYYVEISG